MSALEWIGLLVVLVVLYVFYQRYSVYLQQWSLSTTLPGMASMDAWVLANLRPAAVAVGGRPAAVAS